MHQKGSFIIWGGAIPQSVDVEEFAAGFVRFDNGATMMLEVSWMLHHKTPGEDMQMWLYGDKAGAHWPSNEICSTSNKTKQQMNTQLQVAEGGEPHAKECMDFAECVAKGRPSPVPAEQSLNVLSILDALYKSSEQGKEVKVEI
jgi:predicted dehydrogenase